MEGDGEGLVAIVQGLENSGVTLTVCNRPRLNQDRSRTPGQRIQINAMNQRSDLPAVDQRSNMLPAAAGPPALSPAPPVQRNSVETSTGTDFSRMATASQICDGRYASSYKLAHCMVSPTSPPEAVTEFPPQRKEPCRNQGNFEIGGHSAQCSGHGIGHHHVSCHGTVPVRVSTSRVRHYGGTQTWPDKGSSHRYSKSNHRETEAFAHSLRKYPSMAPFRTASTDLIEKLIRYTQAKNYQEMSRSTKSLRSLRHQKSSDNSDTVRPSKHQQTYTRRQDEHVTSSHVQVGYRGRTKNFKLYAPMSDSRHLRESRHRETTCSSSYDYLKAGNPPHGRSNRSDGSPSPTCSRSPERRRSPEESPRSRSPVGSRSPEGSRVVRAGRSSRADRPLRFERSVRDLSLSEMSRYIRSTIRQICNERPVVVQVCPKLKDRFNQHRKVCPSKNERSDDVMEFEEEEEDPEDRASGSVLSRFLQSFSGRAHTTEQTGCQCSRADCYCSKATQCVNNPEVSTAACCCTTPNKSCCRGMACLCATKAQTQAYYNKRIDEEISEWLKDVPVTSVEDAESKMKRETIIKELRNALKQLTDDENFEENAANEIQGFVDDFPLWNPGKDENDEKLFKNQLADKLTEKIIAIPRKPDRFRDIVKKWVAYLDFEDNGEEVDKDAIIDNFVNRLKSLAADRPACDVKYMIILRKEIIELLVELALKFNGDMAMLKKTANNLAKEIVNIPRNVILSGDTSDLTSEFEDKIADWICEHGLCNELKKNPKLIEGLAKKLNKLKSQGIYDDDVAEQMKQEVQQFVDDVGLAFETVDELIEELMKQISSTIRMKEKERLDQEELLEEVSNWLHSLPGDALHPRKLERMTKDLVKMIQDSDEEENDNLASDIFHYLSDTGLSLDSADLGIYVEELMDALNILPSDKFYKEQAKRMMLKDIHDIIDVSPITEDKKEKMKSKAKKIVEFNLRKSSLNLKHDPDNVKESLLHDMDDAISDMGLSKESQLQLKSLLSVSINKNYDKSFTRLNREQSDLKQTIAKDVKNAIKELPIDADKKKDLMQQVKGSLSKNMDKPLPNDIQSNINDDISDVIEKCPICEDRSILGRIKKVLSEIATKHLTIYLPPCVCDIQNEVEQDVSGVIDRSSIDTGQKRELKENIQDILAENKDLRLSDEVIKNIQTDISRIVSDVSIPQDEKDDLKMEVNETVLKDFNEAGKAFRHDLNKIRNKLLDDITNVIEKSPIERDVKSHLKEKLDNALAKNLDSSLSNDEKHMILDDVSNIIRNDMPNEKRMSLTNKLAKKLDIQPREEAKKRLIETMDRLSIDSDVKDDMKKEVEVILLESLHNPLSSDVEKKIEEDITNAIDELDIPKDVKKNLISDISHAIAEELEKLNAQNIEVPKIKMNLEKVITNEIKNSPISEDEQEELEYKIKDIVTKNLDQAVTDKVKETIRERLEHIVDDQITDKGKADSIKTQLLDVVNEDVTKSPQPRQQLRSNERLRDQKRTMDLKEAENEAVDHIVLEMERALDEAPLPRGKKNELKKRLKNITIKNFEKPLDDVTEGLQNDISEIFDELNIPKDKKDKLERNIIGTVERNMDNLLEKTKDIDTQYSDIEYGEDLVPEEAAAKDNILKGIENYVDESAIPKGKKLDLKRKLKTFAAENLKRPFSEDVQESIKTGIADIIDELPIAKSEKNKFQTELTSILDENVDNLRVKPLSDVSYSKKTAENSLQNPFQEMVRAIEESSIPRGKKKELKKKLNDLATQDFKKIPSENVAEAMKGTMNDIIDELNLPKDKKNKLKTPILNAVDKYQKNLQSATENKATEYPSKKQRQNEDTYRNSGASLKPIEEFDATKVKDTILKRISKNITQSAIPEEKKIELKINDLRESEKNALHNTFQEVDHAIDEASIPRAKKKELKKKLKNLATQNFNKKSSDDAAELRDDVIEIIDDLNLPKNKKNKLETSILDAVDKYQQNLKISKEDKVTEYAGKKRKQNADTYKNSGPSVKSIEEFDANKVNDSILKGIDKNIDQSAISEEKKVELKKKLKKLAAENLKKPFSQDVQDTIETGIANAIDELSIPKSEKNKLKRTLINMVDENVHHLRGTVNKTPTEVDDLKELEKEPLHETFEEVDRAIEEASIPKRKKKELKKKLNDLATKNLNQRLSDDIAKALGDDVIEIIDELNLPKDKKNKLRIPLLTAADQYKNNLQTAKEDKATEYPGKKRRQNEDTYRNSGPSLKPIEEVDVTKVEDSILRGIDKNIEQSGIPKEKKIELKRKLKKLAAENLKKPFSQDVEDTIETGIADAIDELSIPKSEKNKLKQTLINMVDKDVDHLRGAANKTPTEVDDLRESEKEPLHKTFEEVDRAIEEASIPRRKKTELKNKLKNLATKNFNKKLSDDSAEALGDDVIEIIDGLNLPKDKKNKLKSPLLTAVGQYKKNLQAAREDEHTDYSAKNRKPSEDGNKKTDEGLKPIEGVEATKVKDNIWKTMEKNIEESTIPEGKKTDLKRQLKTLASQNLKNPYSKDQQVTLKSGIADIIDSLPISKSEKIKSKRELTSIVDENVKNLRLTPRDQVDHLKKSEDKPFQNVFKEMDRAIEVASIPKEKKNELKKKLKDLASKDFKKKSPRDVAEAIEGDMTEIMDELNLPKDKKNKLKSALTSIISKKVDKLPSKPRDHIDHSEELDDLPLHNIFHEMELTIKEAPLPKEKKNKLRKMLQDLATKDFDDKSLDEIAEALKDDIIEIIDELNLPKDKNNKLKSTVKNMIDENMEILLDEPSKPTTEILNFEELEDDTQRNILQGFEKAVIEAPVPKDTHLRLKRKLRDVANKNFKKPLSDEVAQALKDDTSIIVDEQNLPKDKKNALKNSLTAVVDENMNNYKNEKLTKSPRYQHISPEKRRKISHPKHIIDESNLKESIKDEIKKSIAQAQIADKKKSTLQLQLVRMISGMLAELDEKVDQSMIDIFNKYGINSDYQKTLAEEFNKLLEIGLKGGDFEYARKKLIAKLMRDLNLSEEEASALADEMINKAREMGKIQGKSIQDIIKEEVALATKDQIVPEQKDEMAQYKEVFTTAINNAVKQLTVSKLNKSSLKNNLLKILNQTIDESSNKNDIGALKAEVLQECKKTVDASSIPTGKKKELKSLIKKEIAKAFGDDITDYEESSDDDMVQKQVKRVQEHEELTPVSKVKIVPKQKDEITEYKELFTTAINNAVEQSTLNKLNKSSLKNKLLRKLKQTIDKSSNKNDKEALRTEVLQECKKIVDASSLPAGKKKELKSLIKKEMAKAFGDEIMDDESSDDDDVSEESSLHDNPTPEEYKEKIIECIKTWMESLPMDIDPEAMTAVAEDLASDIIDRQKYFQAHPEVISADNDEIENLKYQVFRRMNNVVNNKDLPLVMDRTEELYRMIMGIETPEGVPKLQQSSSREQSSSEKRRRDEASPNRKQSTSDALSSGNINYSLKELIATNKSVRRQWSRHLDNALSKLPQLKSESKDLKDKLVIYDETGQINILSALSTTKEETNNDTENSKSSKEVTPKPTLKINNGKTSARLSKIEEAISFNNNKPKSPFIPNSNDPATIKGFTQKVKDSINNWLKKARLDIDQNEKNRILEEFANDVFYRQKYVQAFGKTPSRSENLEYLKLQIHRRFNGLVPVEVLKKIIENAKDLAPQIEKVQAPQLVQAPQIVQVAQRSRSPAKRKLGPADILGIRSKATNTTRADGVSHTVDDDDGVEEASDTEFNPGQASTPSKSAAEQQAAADAEYFDKVIESVTKWIESMPIDLEPDVQADVINDLTSDIVDRQKYLQVHPDKKFSEDEEIENLRFQVFKRLDKVVDADSSVTPTLAKIEELYKMIAGDGRKKSLTAKQAQEFQMALNEEISAILNNYHVCCDKRELLPKLASELTKLRKSGADQDEIVENLIATIQPLTYLSDEDAEELAYKLLFRTKKLIATIRGDVSLKKQEVMKDTGEVYEAEGYVDNLGIPPEESNATEDDTGPESKSRYGMSFNGLSNFIDTWLSSIHTEDDDTKDEDELMDEKRKRMYCLVHKIGEMNVDPEIFNDDALYEAVLREELQRLLGDIKMDEGEFQALKEELVEKVLEAQRRAHDEIAGQNYKKKLRDTMSKLLPDQKNFSKDDQATIETLKDQLADAYIDLHYSGNDENQRDRLKRKIASEINTFCKDYLNRNPCSPLNSKTLNNDLYTALNKVPLPPGDSIRYEVEQARIREEINDWVKELPLHPQNPSELLARNKLIYVLSKKLFDIEVEEQEEDDDNELMRKHIVSFLNKLPLESEEEYDAIADTLINKLKASQESRKYDATSNVTVDAAGNVTAASTESWKPSICPEYKWLFEKRKPCAPHKVCARHTPRRFESFPPCTLSPEDKAHLERIRRRTCVTPGCVASLIKKHKCEAGAGPPPVDAGSQTILKPFSSDEPQQSRICPFAYEKTPKPCPRTFPHPHQPCGHRKTESVETEKPQASPICPAAFERTPRTCTTGPSKSPQGSQQMRRHTISSSNISDCNDEVQPNGNIKQYYWEPCDKNSVHDSEQQQSGRSSRRQSDTAPCNPAPPCHTPRPAPCRPAPCGSPKPAPCTTPRPAPCSSPKPTPCRPTPCVSSRPAPCRPPPCPPPRPATCHQPGPCDPSPPCFFPTPPCRRPSSAKLKQQSSSQPKSPRQNSSERYSYFDPQNSFAKSSHRDIPSCRSPCAPSPCMSSFGQYTPPGSPGFSKRFNECRMPKRDGLQDREPSTSSKPSQKERVIELGSLDDVNAKPKKRPSDQSDWPKFHEDEHFWTAPLRRVILDEGIDESVVMERERREERVSCRCKERLVPSCGRSQPGNCPSQPFSTTNEDGQNLKRCSKCCGIHCPYPSFLYFRQ